MHFDFWVYGLVCLISISLHANVIEGSMASGSQPSVYIPTSPNKQVSLLIRETLQWFKAGFQDLKTRQSWN